ncbi:tetratricopeptide repeat-containing sensor histidine kinase [Ancylomarina sp. 16SWW S1-10-2]|uniref:tetratricopeptide repeat-containing sensor histidine kinase n=1 Tax=Ancylomarina sp. 16SWW S1-10-2 TaxID=2499681 RepID=UPI0012AE04E3|nr:tetratricopeptide repeat-containing sensor histidine kinase [Ancylomarina sp. 16SWW S1-10-2]MRT92883.1 tetratricopeptide repeat protein [Ancylomarina sp. 16SWW S1-10-2]
MKYIYLILLISLSNILTAQSKIDSLEALLPNKQGLEKVEILNKLAFSYWNVSPDKGISYAKTAYTIALKEDSKVDMAKALKCIGINHWAKSQSHLALKNLQKSLKIYEEINDLKGICSLYSNIGLVYKDLSDYKNSLKYFLKSLKISEEHKITNLIITTNYNISVMYMAQEDYPKALKYAQEAIDLSEKHHNSSNLSTQLNLMAQIYEVQKDYIKAKNTYIESLELNKKNGNNYGTTVSLYNIGNVEYNLKNYDSAITYFNESLTLSKKIDDRMGVLLAYKSIGLVQKELKKHNTALSFYKKALDLSVELDVKEERLEIYKYYSHLYKSSGEFNKSLVYLEKFISLKDSIYSENSSKQIAEMQTKYDSEQKEKENELLRKNNEIQDLEIAKQTTLKNSFIASSILVILIAIILYNRFKIKKEANDILFKKNKLIEEQKEELLLKNNKLTEQYDQVKILNATKNKLFKIISHDLKSPFNSILGFTDILNSNYDSFDNDERIDMINEISKSSHFAYDLLINLLTWARTQTGEIKIKKEPLVLKDLVQKCVDLYGQSASAKHINIAVSIPNDIKLIVDKNTSMIFIGNLINNAIKFTPDGGLITINTSEKEESVNLHIVDTGVGMTPKMLNNLFKIDENTSTKGTNNEKGTGLGLILCKEFIEKNGGNIKVTSEVGKGSEFIISLPKPIN